MSLIFLHVNNTTISVNNHTKMRYYEIHFYFQKICIKMFSFLFSFLRLFKTFIILDDISLIILRFSYARFTYQIYLTVFSIRIRYNLLNKY